MSKPIIYDLNQKPYSVSLANPDDLQHLPNGLVLDRRILHLNADWKCGLNPDLEHSHFQVYIIKDKTQIVGLTTLLCIPYKNLFHHGYLQVNNGVARLKPIPEVLGIHHPDTIMIECGFTQLLPAYRKKKLGVAILNNVILPQIQECVTKFSGKAFVLCSAQGTADSSTTRRIRNLWDQYLNKTPIGDISIPLEDLGKVDPQARFTEIAAKSMGLQSLYNVYSFSLGPVFIRKV